MLAVTARMQPHLNVNMREITAQIKQNGDLLKHYRSLLQELKRQKQFGIALIAQEEMCRLLPDSSIEKSNLVQMLCIANHKERAALVMAELLDSEPGNRAHKARFNRICTGLAFRNFDPLLKRALQSCFDKLYEFDFVKIYPAWITLVFLDPGCSGIRIAERLTNEEDLFDWLETASIEEMNFFSERFFLDGLRLLYITNPLMESFLTSTRKWLCTNAPRLAGNGRREFFVPFLIALGQQCSFNEYIYEETPEEIKSIDEIIGLKESPEIPGGFRYALVSCYRNLRSTFPDHEAAFRELAACSESFSNLVKMQVFDLIDEERIKGGIRSFGTFRNQVSVDVQEQYEQNPYPRWISVACFPPLNKEGTAFESKQPAALDILIAGCGTGRQALDVAALHPTSKVLAIDLSRASLAHAQRKATESGLASRLEFVQADILNMQDWEGQFDYIESSGVLHHMEDPFTGWRILTEKLKPGGHFKLALYSSTARKSLARFQNIAREKQLSPSVEGVRALRRYIRNLPAADAERNHVLNCNDFYTTSEARDFLFHVLEHQFTLLQIRTMLDELGLQFAGFHLDDASTLSAYDSMFPEDINRLNLENWHLFEQKNPLTFKSMYQFWCRKLPDARPAAGPDGLH